MKRDIGKLVNKANEKRLKLYYNLTELQELTGMSIRSLKYRMLAVKEKYNNVPTLLYKKYRVWNIHYSLIDEFKPKYKTKNRALGTYDLKTMVTWNPRLNYDIKYHIQMVVELKKLLPSAIYPISYAIELDSRGYNHTHLVTTADVYIVNKAMEQLIEKYFIDKKDFQFKIEHIQNKYSTVEYIKKAPLASGVI